MGRNTPLSAAYTMTVKIVGPDAQGQQEDNSAGRDAVHYLVRINQTILTLIEELTPDIAERAAA